MNSFFVEIAIAGIALVCALATAGMWRKMDRDQRAWAVFVALSVTVLWAYLSSMEKVFDAWKSPQYSHGYLIPIFAGVLLYLRRKQFVEHVPSWQQWLGLGIIVAMVLIRLFSAQRAIMTLDRVTLIPSLIGVMMIIGGLPAVKWSAGPIAFLFFMFPFPTAVERGLLNPLQSLATKISHFSLETLGIECFTEGNRIMLDGIDLGVVDACSGLRMLTIFVALSTAIAMISSNRPWWERIIIVLSSIPIALTVNSVRITLTGLAYNSIGNHSEMVRVINTFAHDFAGWIMMPMAMGLLYLEYQILTRLIIEEEPEKLSPIGIR